MSVSGYSGFDPSQSAASERNKTRLYSAPGYETARVLITVKTSPNPSAKYGDTVCVAGIRTDREAYEWIRLYPVNFRWLSAEHQFKKYEIVTVNVKKRDGRDPRPESYTPDLDNLVRTGEVVKKWSERLEVVSKMPVDTMFDLIAAAGLTPVFRSGCF